VLAAVLLAAWLVGCGDGSPPAAETPARDAAAREGLPEIPHPQLANLPEPVERQLTDERQDLDRHLADPSVPAAELARRIGEMGELYQAYDLQEAALASYRAALALTPEDPRWIYLTGVVEQLRGHPEAAAERYRRVLALRPDDPAASARLAEVQIQLDQPEAAAEIYRRLLESPETAAIAHYGLGRLASAREDFQAAVDHFERALELQPEAESVHYLLGLAYGRLGDRETAQYHLDRMDVADVTFPDPLAERVENLATGVGAHVNRGLAAFGAGRLEEAVAEYEKALEIDPENPAALRGLGFVHRQAKDYRAAAEALRKLLEVDPRHRLGRMELATVLMEAGELEEAIAQFERVLEIDPDFEQARFNLGVALSRVDRWADAATELERVLEINPKDQDARYYLAIARHQLGEWDRAVELLRQVVAEEPGHFLAHQRLGDYLARRGELEAAAEQHRAVLDLDDAPRHEKALAHYQLGRLAHQEGHAERAVDHFRAARDLLPELWQATLALGNSLRQLGRPGAAAAEYARLVAADPKNVLARTEEAEALIAAGRHAEALERLEAGLLVLPQSAELGNLLARLLATAPDPALRDGERALELAKSLFEAIPSLDHAETVAMAMAEEGRFEEAVDWQRKIIAQAEKEGRADELPRLRRNLERYRQGQPARVS
jgi:superkiller protein 3